MSALRYTVSAAALLAATRDLKGSDGKQFQPAADIQMESTHGMETELGISQSLGLGVVPGQDGSKAVAIDFSGNGSDPTALRIISGADFLAMLEKGGEIGQQLRAGASQA